MLPLEEARARPPWKEVRVRLPLIPRASRILKEASILAASLDDSAPGHAGRLCESRIGRDMFAGRPTSSRSLLYSSCPRGYRRRMTLITFLDGISNQIAKSFSFCAVDFLANAMGVLLSCPCSLGPFEISQ